MLLLHKDLSLHAVCIDDRLPVLAKTGRLAFASCRDPDELWVPLIEKAYAKLHGSYGSLIGGHAHLALADLTGLPPRVLGLRQGAPGFVGPLSDEELWALLTEQLRWGSLLGCSILSEGAREAEAGLGLHAGHAYSLLDAGAIEADGRTVRLVKCRNPWGRGEWEGDWGDRSDERSVHREAIARRFSAEEADVDFQDGTFFMSLEDWRARFGSLFMAVRFPSHWTGACAEGRWQEAGGGRATAAWSNNPRLALRLGGEGHVRVFLGLYTYDLRRTLGADYFKDAMYATPLAFDVVEREQLGAAAADRATVARSRDQQPQPPYAFGASQAELLLCAGEEYLVVPSLYRGQRAGAFYVIAWADAPLQLLVEGVAVDAAREREERLRARLASEALRLGVSVEGMAALLQGEEGLTKQELKRRLVDRGFNLTDFPDEQLAPLDRDGSGRVSSSELLAFLRLGLVLSDPHSAPPPPPPPPDDLALQPAPVDGSLEVHVLRARHLCTPSARAETTPCLRPLRYDPSFRSPRPQGPRRASLQPRGRPLYLASPSQRLQLQNADSGLELLSPRSAAGVQGLGAADLALVERARGRGKHAPALLSAELRRSSHLAILRAEAGAGQGVGLGVGLGEEGVLRGRARRVPRARRSVGDDAAVRSYLACKGSAGEGGEGGGTKADLWDELIDCVLLVCESRPRADLFASLAASLPSDGAAADATASLGASLRRGPGTASLGTAPTPRTRRSAPGTASVTRLPSAGEQRDVLRGAREELRRAAGGPREVFRRLAHVAAEPWSLEQHLASHAKRDREALTGPELRAALRELNVALSEEDLRSLLGALGCTGGARVSSLASLVRSPSLGRADWGLLAELDGMRAALGEHACPLASLQPSAAAENSRSLRALGVRLSVDQVARLSRAFGGSLAPLASFLRGAGEAVSQTRAMLQGVRTAAPAFDRLWTALGAVDGAVSEVAAAACILAHLPEAPEGALARQVVANLLADAAARSPWGRPASPRPVTYAVLASLC